MTITENADYASVVVFSILIQVQKMTTVLKTNRIRGRRQLEDLQHDTIIIPSFRVKQFDKFCVFFVDSSSYNIS